MKNLVKIFACALALSTPVLSTSAAFADSSSRDTTTVHTSTLSDDKSAILKAAAKSLPTSVPAEETPAPCKDRLVTSKKYTPEQKAAITGMQLSGQSK
ncbi:hypothetical protein [Telluribacter sp. SYSU D00476]|uniref:hypothetical protein n=1 Tax=Telluribacter sp. SYSU D00476 TaxID=2811430 RepID=UPI001FF577F9|nr:hypothetical protein [Telluribacter sp. SYSU D00476]